MNLEAIHTKKSAIDSRIMLTIKLLIVCKVKEDRLLDIPIKISGDHWADAVPESAVSSDF